MKTICLYFEIHQIIHLKRYRCFDIGTDHYYYDDYENERSITEIAERSYIPALTTLLEMVKNNGGAFKVAFSISGVALEQLEIYSPAVIDLLHQLNDTGCCEFLCEPYSHGLSSLANEECFREEVYRMSAKIKQVFGQTPKVFRNSSLIYSNEIGSVVASMGFKGILTEGAKHVLGWKSPHYVYHCAYNPNRLDCGVTGRRTGYQYFYGAFCLGDCTTVVFEYPAVHEGFAGLCERKGHFILDSV